MTISRLPGVPYAVIPKVATVSSALAQPPRLVVLHDTSNTASAAAEANYAATRSDAQSNWTSAHFYVDTAGALGSSPLDRQAWAAFSYANQHGVHVEMCGMNAGQPNAVPQTTIDITAVLFSQICDTFGIPKIHLSPSDVAAGKSGICGHYDITVGLGVGDHDDPGPAFNWTAFIAAVNAGGSVTIAQTDVENIGRNTARLVQSGAFDQSGFNNLQDPIGKEMTARAVNPIDVVPPIAADVTQPHPNGRLYGTLNRLSAQIANLPTSGGGLSDADRALIQANTDAALALKASVDTLAHQLSSP